MRRKPIRRDSAADPPLAALLVFLSLVSVILFLAMDVPLTHNVEQVNISDEHEEVRGEVDDLDDVGLATKLFADTLCIMSLGLAELVFDDVCSVGVVAPTIAGALQNIQIIRQITEGLSSFVSLVGNLATINIPGAPTWVRFALGMPIVGVISYTVILIVRGN